MQGIQKELILINRRLDAQKKDMEKMNERLLDMEQSNKSEKGKRESDKTSNLDKEENFTQRDNRNDQLTYMGCSNDQFVMDSFSSSFRVNDMELPEASSSSTGGLIKTPYNLCLCSFHRYFFF